MNSRRDFLKLAGGSLVGSYIPVLGSGVKPQWTTIYLEENQIWWNFRYIDGLDIKLYNNISGKETSFTIKPIILNRNTKNNSKNLTIQTYINNYNKYPDLLWHIVYKKNYEVYIALDKGWKIMQKPLYQKPYYTNKLINLTKKAIQRGF